MKLLPLIILFFVSSAFATGSPFDGLPSTIKVTAVSSLYVVISGNETSMAVNDLFNGVDSVQIAAVKGDALDYLADEEMTDSLEEVVIEIEANAIEQGNQEFIGNPDRIIFEIAKF